MSTTFIPPKEINRVAGPPFLSVLLSCGLLGVLSVQVFLHYLVFPKDPTHTKVLIYTVYLIEVAQSVVVIQSAFGTYVKYFDDPYIFDKIGTLWLVPLLTSVVTLLVQCYYAYRINIVTESKKMAILIVTLSIAQLGGAISLSVFAVQKKSYSALTSPELLLQAGVGTGIWNVGSVLCDLIIAVYMTYYLSKFDTTIKRTKIFLTKIIRLTLETGSLTTIIGIICFALAIIPSSPYYYQTAMGLIGKVYANSMMVLINSRIQLGSIEDDEDDETISTLRFQTVTNMAKDDESQPQNTAQLSHSDDVCDINTLQDSGTVSVEKEKSSESSSSPKNL